MKTQNMSLQESARLSVDQKKLSPQLNEQLNNVVQLLDDIKGMKPDNAIRDVISRVKYLDYLLHYSKGNSMDYDARLENLEQLVYSASKKNTAIEFLEEAALIKGDQDDFEKNKKARLFNRAFCFSGGERGIRTLGAAFTTHSLSRRAPSAGSAISPWFSFVKLPDDPWGDTSFRHAIAFHPCNAVWTGGTTPAAIQRNGGGSRIRTHGAFTQRFSRPPP
jgi:hypothetical protein